MTDINVPPRDFKVGDDVVCLNFGIGKVTSNTGLYGMPIKVKFDNTKEEYTENGAFVTNSKRCLFHADENVKVTVTNPVYDYQLIYKLKGGRDWFFSGGRYKSVKEYREDLGSYESIELFLPSKMLVKNNTD